MILFQDVDNMKRKYWSLPHCYTIPVYRMVYTLNIAAYYTIQYLQDDTKFLTIQLNTYRVVP